MTPLWPLLPCTSKPEVAFCQRAKRLPSPKVGFGLRVTARCAILPQLPGSGCFRLCAAAFDSGQTLGSVERWREKQDPDFCSGFGAPNCRGAFWCC